MNTADKLASAEAEVARLENITKIQQKQIERLMAERDATNPFRTELLAVARAVDAIQNSSDWPPNKSTWANLEKAMDSLEAKGWKSSD